MNCEIEVHPAALRALKLIDHQDRRRIHGAIGLLAAGARRHQLIAAPAPHSHYLAFRMSERGETVR